MFRNQCLAVACMLSLGSLSFPASAQRAVGPASSDVAGQTSDEAPATPNPLGTGGNPFVFGGDLETHLQGEVIKPSNTVTHGNIYDDTNLEGYANYQNWLSLNTDAKLERNRNDNDNDYFPDRNTFFRSEGMTLRQLYLTVRPTSDVAVYGGKIHPSFGSAYEQEPGNFYNFGTDYEQDERIGAGVQYRLPEALGLKNARVSLEAYYLDTSFLSTSLLSGPALDDPDADRLRRYTRGAYGPSNTGSLDSFTASLRGGQPERGLTYQASLTREATDDPAGKTELGESFSLSYDPTGDGIPVTGRLGVTPFLEYTHFDNFAGIADLERHYVIAGADFIYGRWQTALAAGLRKSEGISTATDHQQSLSLNYAVTPKLTLGGGINHITVDGQGSWAAGPSLNYEIAF